MATSKKVRENRRNKAREAILNRGGPKARQIREFQARLSNYEESHVQSVFTGDLVPKEHP